ncbi:DUF6531 domain-containing protein [Streptomyces tricolor]|nr:DUF6531 domain-containing protein [Streptomyces tricolor]
MTQTDLVLPGSLPLEFTRTHLSSYRGGVCFGPTWISTWTSASRSTARGRLRGGRRHETGVPGAGSGRGDPPGQGPALAPWSGTASRTAR